jgi:hypothetical protein
MRRGINRTLATCGFVAACAFGSPAFAVDHAAGLGKWRDYAARGLTPDFDWAEKPAEASVRPTVFDTAFAPNVARVALRDDLTLGLSFARGRAERVLEADGRFDPLRLATGAGLERTYLSTSLTHAVDDATSITAAAILADQRFATPGFGSNTYTEFSPSMLPLDTYQRSYGAGVRLSVEERLTDALSLTTAYQSEIGMDPLQAHRGVYGSPGDFDIPAVASAGLAWSPSARHTIGFDVQRVFYSNVPAFASSALPPQFLQSLGDSDSPTFNWRDLTVYAVNWTWRTSSRDAIQLRYSSQQQPEPADGALRATLDDSFTDDNFGFAYLHDLGLFGRLELAASYAGSPYFLGNWSRPDRDLYGDQVEVEAVWSMDF